MHPSHIAPNGVEQQSVILHALHPNSSIARMPLVLAVLVVLASVTCILLLPLMKSRSPKSGGWVIYLTFSIWSNYAIGLF